MSTHSRLHGSTSYRVPWAYEDDTPENPENACAVLRFFTKLKGRLMPYLFSQAVKTSSTGVPMMRAMVIDFAEDPAVFSLTDNICWVIISFALRFSVKTEWFSIIFRKESGPILLPEKLLRAEDM